MISAKVIADSVGPNSVRLTSIQATVHRYVLAELNTHRAFSRNSASSRAIPVAKQLERIRKEPALPVSFPFEQKGMQGGDELDGTDRFVVEAMWNQCAEQAAANAESLSQDYGVHKSVTNRILEPYMWHTVLITASDWQGFFKQRCSALAQPEIRVAAEMIREVYDASQPRRLHLGDWHLPYLTLEDAGLSVAEQIQVSVARCARTSYLTQEGVRDVSEDLTLYSRLVSADPMHASPLEHVATPAPENAHWVGITTRDLSGSRRTYDRLLPKYGNLLGWHSHRYDLET